MLVEASGTFVRMLREKMTVLPPVSLPRRSTLPSHIPPALHNAKEVYVRNNAVRQPLQRSFDGPFKFITSGEKNFVIDRRGTPYTVSTDRVKLAVPDPHRLLRDHDVQNPIPSAPAPVPVPNFLLEEDFPPLHTIKTSFCRVSRLPNRLNL